MKKDKLKNKVAVSRSPAMICSADAPGENAERELLEQAHCVYCAIREQSKPLDADIAKILSDDFWLMFDRF